MPAAVVPGAGILYLSLRFQSFKRLPVKKKIFIGISGINAIDNPGPGIGVARSLKEEKGLNAVIVGLAYDAMEPGIYMDWLFDKSFIMPYPSANGEAYFERLLYIRESYGLDYVIPNLDVELPFYIKYADRLKEKGIRTFLPALEDFHGCSKERLKEVSGLIGTKLPKTEVVNNPEALADAVAAIGLPVMVKGHYYGASRAENYQQAVSLFNKVVAEWGYPVIIQEIISGTELNVVGLGDGKGTSAGLVCIRKVGVTSLGKIWTGVTVQHGAMLDAANRFAAAMQWKGPFELECMSTGDDIYLIEINPRFPAWTYFATAVGINLPLRLIRMMMGKPPGSTGEYEAGRLFVRYTYEIVTDIEAFQRSATRGENP
jgi:carbamoyl-phosphate synthase large subunit